MSETRVRDCPSCGAPLPAAADGIHFTCTFCNAKTVLATDEAAVLAERASLRDAEALFARLGRPPTFSQKVAVVLTNGWAWLFGFPIFAALLLRIAIVPERWLSALWERFAHARPVHVAPPSVGWLLTAGPVLAIVLFVLVWSLLGARVDARRELQAALAAKPPTTPGGPARCRHCDAALEVPAGALGARCSFCQADNLVQLPAAWVARAKTHEHLLRVSTAAAKRHDQIGRRRVRRAAAWRLPLIGLFAYLLISPSVRARRDAGWHDLRLPSSKRFSVYETTLRVAGKDPERVLHTITHCDDALARRTVLHDSKIEIVDGGWCGAETCRVPSLFALARGDRLELSWVARTGDARIRLAIASHDYQQGAFAWEYFGDERRLASLPAKPMGETAFVTTADVSGWWHLQVIGPPGTIIEPCVVPAP